MFNCIICRYHEIATKGNNRAMFERCLVDNIRYLLKELPVKVGRVRGRVWVRPAQEECFTADELEIARKQLEKCFGLESFSPAVKLPVEMEDIRAMAVKLGAEAVESGFAAGGKPVTFRIRARRSNKHFPMSSREIEIDLVTRIAEVTGEDKFKIDLDNAEITLGCEIRDEFALLFFNAYSGPGGLPVGCNPRVLTLLSGGIDSPAAAYLIMKRGSPTDYLTFHSAPYTPPETTEKVKRLAAVLNSFQMRGTLYMANLSEFQKLVRDCCRERYRTILYRRAMMRIAELLALRNRQKALVTGEALGQVASQTVPNMYTIGKAVDMLILRPLVGTDKLESIALAEKIGTFEISKEQVPDSCTVFAPSQPCTSADPETIEAEEAKIPGYREILEKIVTNIEEWA